MKQQVVAKAPWINRFSIVLFATIVALLFYWLLGFLVRDIRTIPGPDYSKIEKQYLDQALLIKKDDLNKQINSINREMNYLVKQQSIVRESSNNLQQTIRQLTALQRQALKKGSALSSSQQKTLRYSLNNFLASQKKYQDLNSKVSDLSLRMQDLALARDKIVSRLHEQTKLAQKHYDKLMAKHRLKLAFFQLIVLLPLLFIAIFLLVKNRASIYLPLFMAFAITSVIKVTGVVHEYFPTKYFKYILILVLLAVVIKLLISLIRSVAFPKQKTLLKQYREAYERFLCPICEYPIRTGPRKFLYWTRRSVKKVVLSNTAYADDEIYTCPACGTALYEECQACHGVRHALLNHCQHCGAQKD